MRNRILIYGILVSIGIHFILLSNIKFNFSNDKSLEIQLVQMPPELIKDNLAPQKNINQETSENLKKSLKSRIKESEEKTYCELCGPVSNINETFEEPIYGESIKSIEMVYKVFHDLGPNKGSIDKIKPFGVGTQGSIKDEKNSISKVGSLGINYKVDKNNYEIYYEAKAEGISSFFYSQPLIQKSRGLINILGLRPDYYLYSHGKKKTSEAFFDWKSKTLTINRKETTNKYGLINQAQDQLSFMFQFMFLDPLNKMQIPITNAKVFKIYNYHYVDELNMDTKLGSLDVLHVAKFNYQSPERIDLWLAKKYGYLPVKISITEDDLSSIIQKIETLKIKKINE
ncbi:DUF3108 domain-containing protein [Methylophilaceae bacterium]|jgi:hypothetical protein|nr:DUF3108 domain-containing protein [Methylophilaceae bacterium]